MTNSMWRVLDGEGNEQGPYSFQDLQGFYTTGNINHETMIWTDGLEEWVKAGRVEGLLPDLPQVVASAPAPSAQVAPVQAAPVGGMNLNPQISGITTPALGATTGKSLPGWICWSTILIGLLSIILYFLPWASISCDQKAFGKEGRIDVLSQTGFQSISKKYSLNVEFIKLPLLMMGMPEDKANLAAEKMVAGEFAQDESNDELERSTLALITLILAAVGLILAFIAYAVQGRFLLLGAQVLFVAGALLLSIQISKQFPVIESMEEKEREMREAIAGAQAAENEAAKAIEEFSDILQSKIEASCYVVVVLLGLSLLLLIIMMSMSKAPPAAVPQLGATTAQPQVGGFRLQ